MPHRNIFTNYGKQAGLAFTAVLAQVMYTQVNPELAELVQE